MSRWAILLSAAGLCLTLSSGVVLAEPVDMIQPGTPAAAQAIATLSKARDRDRLNARGYTSGADSEARSFYYDKAREAQDLIDQLNAKKSIASTDVAHALDTSGARRYTSGY